MLGALVRGSIGRAVRRSIWPAAATGYAFLFAWVGLPPWANFLVTGVAALLTKDMLRDALPGRPRIVVAARQRRDWRGVVDLDELLP